MDSASLRTGCNGGNYHLQSLSTEGGGNGASRKKDSGVNMSEEHRIIVEIVCLGVVMVILGLLLTLPIIFYHLPVNLEENVS